MLFSNSGDNSKKNYDIWKSSLDLQRILGDLKSLLTINILTIIFFLRMKVKKVEQIFQKQVDRFSWKMRVLKIRIKDLYKIHFVLMTSLLVTRYCWFFEWIESFVWGSSLNRYYFHVFKDDRQAVEVCNPWFRGIYL